MSGNPQDDMITEDELLARYILRRGFVRDDETLKPDPFIPYRRTQLSVTRHKSLDAGELWGIGMEVARQRQQTLYGRGDAPAQIYLRQNLTVNPDPVEGNPNHANVTGWPDDKPAQKAIALEIVKSVKYIPRPDQ